MNVETPHFRRDFEKWVCGIYDRKLQRLNDGYLDPSIDYAWQAWKAAIEFCSPTPGTKGTNLTDTHKPQPQPAKPSPRPTPDDANPPGQPGGK